MIASLFAIAPFTVWKRAHRRRRTHWRARHTGVEPCRLVFIDETWVKIDMAPLRGWGPGGACLIGKAPQGQGSLRP